MNKLSPFTVYSRLFKVSGSCKGRVITAQGSGNILNLPRTEPIVVGIDQSTFRTGLFIRTVRTGGMRVQLDIENAGLPSKEIYFAMMQEFFANNFVDVNVRLIAAEKPLPKSESLRTRSTLTELKGALDLIIMQTPALRTAQLFALLPSQWRKHFLADPKYKGRKTTKEDAKFSTIEEVVCRYPEMAKYDDWGGNDLLDSFDAVGILEGTLEERFYCGRLDVNRYCGGLPNNRSKYEACWDVIDIDTENIEDYILNSVEEYVDDGNELIEERSISTWVVDEALTDPNEVVQTITSNTNTVCIIYFKFRKKADYFVFQWAKQLKREPNQIYSCVAWRTTPSPKCIPNDGYVATVDPADVFAADVEELEILADKQWD